MEYIKLNNSDLQVSRICMGGCPMGGYGWGDVQEKDLIDAVHAALDNGINMFDTADTYGLGQSEITLGKALGSRRKNTVIATKFGVRYENGKSRYDNSPEYIVQAIDKSLKRLNTDYIDIYQIHYRDGVTPISAVIETLEKLQSDGKIRFFGLSNIHKSDFEELEHYVGKFITFQDEYSLACRKNEQDILLLSDRLKINPLTWGSLGQGILTGKYDKNVSFDSNDRRAREIYVNFHGDKLIQNLAIVEEMKTIASKYNKPISAIAIRYILDFLPESVVLCGAKRPSQILDNIKAADWKLDLSDLNKLEEISR